MLYHLIRKQQPTILMNTYYFVLEFQQEVGVHMMNIRPTGMKIKD